MFPFQIHRSVRAKLRYRAASVLVLTLWGLASGLCFAQQIADSSFVFPIAEPRYPAGKGPVVWIDGGHHNFHTLEGNYLPFARLLREDGYQVHASELPLDQAGLAQCRVLVIVNPLHLSNADRWSLPCPSAFSSAEIETLRRWVSAGGSLLLLVDHMPFPGASAELAKALGFTFYNGYALPRNPQAFPSLFTRSDGNLLSHRIMEGVDTIATFTGQAFRIPLEADPLWVFQTGHQLWLPQDAGVFSDTTPTMEIEGFCQGAVRAYGQGRVAVIGEAALFTAQLAGESRLPVGMNSPEGRQNPYLLLNLLHWLDDQEGWEVPASVVKRIKVQNHGMEEAMRLRDALGVAGFYSDDALILGEGSPPVRGREAVNAYWEALPGLDWRLDVHALTPSFEALQQSPFWLRLDRKPPGWQSMIAPGALEDAVYQLGTSTLTYLNDAGRRVTGICDFVLVWQAQRDGSYRILVDSYVCR